MSLINCAGCQELTNTYDTLGGYCMLCCLAKIKEHSILTAENEKLKVELQFVKAQLSKYQGDPETITTTGECEVEDDG